jgi:hypothetical protein
MKQEGIGQSQGHPSTMSPNDLLPTRFFMKPILPILFLAFLTVTGCSGNKTPFSAGTGFRITCIAAGAKTRAGKPVDAYRLDIPQLKSGSIILVVGGGKLESNGTVLSLDGQALKAEASQIAGIVLVAQKNTTGLLPLANATVVETNEICKSGAIIDLPIDECLKPSK